MNALFSIIIPTYKRSNVLAKLLSSLECEKNNVLEIVVVSQGGEKLVKIGENVIVIHLSKPSTPHAMNVGAKRARGEFLLFLDDDVIVRKGLIANHIKNFADPTVAATVGRVITDGQKIEPHRKDTGRINVLGKSSDGFSSTIKQKVDTVIGCNTCWRKSVYLKLGGMDEQFTGNAIRLESDLSLQAKKLGYNIIFEPKAVVEHHRALTGGARKSEGRLRWYFDFFSNETYFFLKHRAHVLLPIFWLTKIEWAFRCMFGFGREVSPRSMKTPITGIIDGIRKYYDYRR
jgi:GT2 family glycosyltransferase